MGTFGAVIGSGDFTLRLLRPPLEYLDYYTNIRIIARCVASFRQAVYVLHAFQKKSQKISRQDLELARRRYRDAKEFDEKE
jgi:phage-related protein